VSDRAAARSSFPPSACTDQSDPLRPVVRSYASLTPCFRLLVVAAGT
jgi:hypothetical protein